MRTYPTVLSIAGSDSSGGAGIQADLKTISAIGVYGMTATTALTAQNTCKVFDIYPSTPEFLTAQLNAVFDDIFPDAIKIGMLFNEPLMCAVIEMIKVRRPKNIVLDPVMVSTSGSRLIEDCAIARLKNDLMPICDIVTPNLQEAEVLAEMAIRCEDDVVAAGKQLTQFCKAVLIKGGHSEGTEMKDMLFLRGETECRCFDTQKIDTHNTHGTGCTLSSAIAAYLALGNDMAASVGKAKAYVTEALASGADVVIGHGHGPVNHLFNPEKMNKI